MTFNDEDTVEDLLYASFADDVTAQSFTEPGIEIGATTHRGRVRSRNEDQYAVVRRTRSSRVLASSVEDIELPATEDHAWLLAVADGLGGEVSGHVASATAIRAILSFAGEISSWIMRPTDGLREDFVERVELYAQAINRDLQEQAESDPTLAGMATTLTAAYLYGSDAVITNVGDSRSYLIRANEIHQITTDHTVAQDMRDEGLSSEASHPYRNLLTRCFNTVADPVSVDLFHVKLRPGDRILLCTDGLTDMVANRAILHIATATALPSEACEQLVAKALENGGRDNITVVLAGV